MRVREVMTSPVKTVHHLSSLPLAASLMELERIRHLPVVDDDARVVGLVTHRDLLSAQISTLGPLSADERTSVQLAVPVAKVMRSDVWTIASEALVVSAARLMRDHRFGCLPVVDDGTLVGMVTESDILALVTDGVYLPPPLRPLKVENAMTLFPITISPQTNIADARAIMDRYRVRHLPVVDGARTVGIVAAQDLRVAEAVYGAHKEASAQVAVMLVGKEKAYETHPEASLEDVLLEMSQLGLSAAMVVDGKRLAGVLTTTDVCRLFAEQLRADSVRPA